MFNKKDEDVYTPQQEDKNAGRKKIVAVVVAVLLIGIVAFNIFKSDEVPGGTTMVKVDQSGQTPGASMYTPTQEQQILNTVVEEDGAIDKSSDQYFSVVPESVTTGVEYIFSNLGRDDNPAIDDVSEQAVLTRMAEETDQWQNVFYSEVVAFELMQLFNLTVEEPMTEDERAEQAANGAAVANPGETYGVIGEDGIVVNDITPSDTPYYVANVVVNYKSEGSLPVRIEFNVSVSNAGRIFDITPIGIQSITEGAE